MNRNGEHLALSESRKTMARLLSKWIDRDLQYGSLTKAAEKMGIAASTLGDMRVGDQPVNIHLIPVVYNAFRPPENEFTELLLAINPEYNLALDKEWLHKKIEGVKSDNLKIRAFNLEKLAFPATDPAWLNKRPEGLRLGLLLQTHRKRKHLSQKDLATAIGKSEYPILCYEHSLRFIPRKDLETICNELKLKPLEKDLVLTAHKSAEELPAPPFIAQAEFLHEYFPELHPRDAAQQLGLSIQSVGNWFLGWQKLTPDNFKTINRLYGGDKQQTIAAAFEKCSKATLHERLPQPAGSYGALVNKTPEEEPGATVGR